MYISHNKSDEFHHLIDIHIFFLIQDHKFECSLQMCEWRQLQLHNDYFHFVCNALFSFIMFWEYPMLPQTPESIF